MKRRAACVALTPHSSCYCELGNLANRDQISACAPVWYSIKEAQRRRGISLGAAVWHFFNCEKGGDLTTWLSACITLIWFAVRWQCVIAQGCATNFVLGDISLSVPCVLYQQAPMKFLLNMTSWSLNWGSVKQRVFSSGFSPVFPTVSVCGTTVQMHITRLPPIFLHFQFEYH